MNIQYEQQQQKKRKRKEKNFKLGLYVCMCVCVCVPFWFHDIRTNDDVILNKKVINNRIVYNGMNMNNEWIHFDINFFKYQNPVLTITIPLFFFYSYLLSLRLTLTNWFWQSFLGERNSKKEHSLFDSHWIFIFQTILHLLCLFMILGYSRYKIYRMKKTIDLLFSQW